MSLSIRRAQAVDAQALLDLRKASILGLCARHYPHEDLQQWRSIPRSSLFLRGISTLLNGMASLSAAV